MLTDAAAGRAGRRQQDVRRWATTSASTNRRSTSSPMSKPAADRSRVVPAEGIRIAALLDRRRHHPSNSAKPTASSRNAACAWMATKCSSAQRVFARASRASLRIGKRNFARVRAGALTSTRPATPASAGYRDARSSFDDAGAAGHPWRRLLTPCRWADCRLNASSRIDRGLPHPHAGYRRCGIAGRLGDLLVVRFWR